MTSAPCHDVAHDSPCRGLRRPAPNDATLHHFTRRGHRRGGTSRRSSAGDTCGNNRAFKHSLSCVFEHFMEEQKRED